MVSKAIAESIALSSSVRAAEARKRKVGTKGAGLAREYLLSKGGEPNGGGLTAEYSIEQLIRKAAVAIHALERKMEAEGVSASSVSIALGGKITITKRKSA